LRTSDEPTISVVVPAYNRASTLGAALDSLLEQTLPDWEAIVVDDGSEDETGKVAEDYAAGDSRIRVIRQGNGGASRARNVALASARSKWTFFLDADDWIAADAFSILLAAAEADGSAEAVVGGCVPVDERGVRLEAQEPVPGGDLFPLFARSCAMSIHSCLVGTELVRRAGGFDESLVTCEDWDLWQRIARLGARFATTPEIVAYYRLRRESASRRGWPMLRDGLIVIDRGHGRDPRLPDERASARPDLPDSGRASARTYFACYAAGLEIAAERDARPMIDELPEIASGDVDPDGVANSLFVAVWEGRATAPARWPAYPAAVHSLCREFVFALGEKMGAPWFGSQCWSGLERLVLGQASDGEPRRVGRWHLLDLDVGGPPPADLELEPGIERILCRLSCEGNRLGELEVAASDRWIPRRVLADAVVAARAWDVLGAFFEGGVYRELELESSADRVLVSRAGRTIFEGPADADVIAPEALHDQIGWLLFLQETWGRPDLSMEDFYAAELAHGERDAAPLDVLGEPVELDVADALPALHATPGEPIDVAMSVGGVPLTGFRLCPDDGSVSPQRLRHEVLSRTGFELCRAVLREAVVLAPAAARGSLQERLRAVRSERMQASKRATDGEGRAAAVGRLAGPDGSAASRWWAFPAAVAAERIALAKLDGDPVSGDGGNPERVVVGPHVLPAGSEMPQPGLDETLLREMEFEGVFGERVDPWRYDTPYEREKYALTAELLPPRIGRVLELGPAEGHFTRRLAERAEHVTAGDISAVALARAQQRCASFSNVTFTQMDAFADDLGGPYDLIVCSEMLYYAGDRETLDRTAEAIAAALRPGGVLLTAHAHAVVDDPSSPGFDWDVPFGAVTIEKALRGTSKLDLKREIRTPAYRVQAYEHRPRKRRLGLPSRPRRRFVRPAAPIPEEGERFLPDGGPVQVNPDGGLTPRATQVPILMYHRVAPQGSEATRRWRLHPDELEEQLSHLRDNGFHSIGFEQWRAAADRRRPIPAGAVMLTFDDGYADFPEHVLPLLARYGFRATVFAVSDLVGGWNEWDERFGERLELMDWSTLAEIADRGIEVGSHSARHRPLSALSPEELARDFCSSRVAFHEKLGFPVRSLCYPYGLHDVAVTSIAGACGFRYGLTVNERPASFTDDLLALPRIEVRGDEPFADFLAKLSP
jgi:peptidoglycan/xylan/chitin deacetylase (PgdA/CDA1 family)/SAM-dependent methyltransferase